jgi:hypothetical protein
MKLDNTRTFQQECIKITEASCSSHRKDKIPHSIGKTLVKPCIICAAKFVLGESSDDFIDGGNCAQLLFCGRYICIESNVEEMLFSQSLKTATIADNIFEAVRFDINDCEWEKFVEVCTDGAAAMRGVTVRISVKSQVRTSLQHSRCNASFMAKDWFRKHCRKNCEKSSILILNLSAMFITVH